MKRRKFVKNGLSFSLLLLLHQKAQALSPQNPTDSLQPRSCRFPEITLYTSKLKQQYEYYAGVLRFPVIKKEHDWFSLDIGESKLIFKESTDGTDPFYHYAINIPSNKYEKAKKWLEAKTPLLKDASSSEELLYFNFWDAHAMYFKDPAGNIGELIARHTLNNDRDGKFGVSDLLCISEIGTPVEDSSDFATELKAVYGLDTFGSSMFIGDEMGLYVAAPVDRLWFPENTQKADVFPTKIITNDKGASDFKYRDYPYEIFNKK